MARQPLVEGALPTQSDPIDPTTDVAQVAEDWLRDFGSKCEDGDVEGVCDLIWENGFWRDILALTWCYRSLGGKNGGRDIIRNALIDRLAISEFSDFKIDSSFEPPKLESPLPGLDVVFFCFTFRCKAGRGSGMARLIPSATNKGKWEALTVSTVLESLHGVKEVVGADRELTETAGTTPWSTRRHAEVEFEDREPQVLIIGAGQYGLSVATRLKALGVDVLIIERLPRVGDQWANRYEMLRLHDPVHYTNLPYLPFPANWPTYAPAKKIADWLYSYALHMDLNVWTSTTIDSCAFDNEAQRWTFNLTRQVNGKPTTRTVKPTIVVYAGGLTGGEPSMPQIEGMSDFSGKIGHSSQYTQPREWLGKKVVVVGAGVSAHDVCKDFAEAGVDVTMIQRSSTYIMSLVKGKGALLNRLYSESSPPNEYADRLASSAALGLLKELHKPLTRHIATLDKDLLDGLRSTNFRINFGEDGSGLLMLSRGKLGGFYQDVGACQLIIDGKIKVKSGSGVAKFTANEVVLDDGSSLPADYVLFATGFVDPSVPIKRMFGEAAKDCCSPMGGFDYERELRGILAAGSGVPNLVVVGGNLASARFDSKPVALQIKAQLVGLFTEADRYTLAKTRPK